MLWLTRQERFLRRSSLRELSCQAQHCSSSELCSAGTVKQGAGTCCAHLVPWLGVRHCLQRRGAFVGSSSCQPGLRLSPAHLHYAYCMSRANQSIAGLTVSLPRNLWTLGPRPHASSAGPAWQCLGSSLLAACSGVVLCPLAARRAHPIPVSRQRCTVRSSSLSLVACLLLTARVWCSAGWRGCGRAVVCLSPRVAVCPSPVVFSSPALQVPSFPLPPVGTLCLCHAWRVTVSCEGARDCPAAPEQALGSPATLLTDLPRQHGVMVGLFCIVLFVCQEEEEEEEDDNISDTLPG